MIYLSGMKWKGSLNQLMEKESPDAEYPEQDKKAIRKIIKENGHVFCAHDPYCSEINGQLVLLYAGSEVELNELCYESSQEI